MSKVPSLNYDRVVKALECSGFAVIRQKGSHYGAAHKPIKRSTLSHILKQAKINAEDFFSFYN